MDNEKEIIPEPEAKKIKEPEAKKPESNRVSFIKKGVTRIRDKSEIGEMLKNGWEIK